MGGIEDMMKGDDMSSMMKLMDTAAKFDPKSKEKPTPNDIGEMENFMKMMDDPSQIDKHPMGQMFKAMGAGTAEDPMAGMGKFMESMMGAGGEMGEMGEFMNKMMGDMPPMTPEDKKGKQGVP